MNDIEQRKKAKEFAERWKDKGYEKGQSQQYWIDLLTNVFGIENASSFIEFEDTVHIDKATGFIDAFIPSTKVLIEQKSIEKDLRKAIKQSDGSLLNPFQQAKRYSAELPYDDRPRWIITCNFKSFLVYDMNNPNGEPEEIFLKDLSKEYYRLSFLIDNKNEHLKKEEEISFKAGEIVGVLYDAFSKQYNDLTQEYSQKSLNELCVRLVFCLYAEDAGLFGKKNIFHDYLAKFNDLDSMRKGLIELFKILDTPLDVRDPYLEDDLNQFPYVNGGLFANENIEIPRFTEEIRKTLLAKASDDFDWSEISPTIFGAVFESTLNPETRRAGGMHYTSIENIHKVIDPLFLDELREELNNALSYKNEKTRNEALDKFQEHLGNLNFFDPACGSGNFLTETYLSLRRLENEAISAKQHGMMAFDMGDVDIIKVHINQLYGIEINDFAVKVATTALWIAESQMLRETEKLLLKKINFLPLKSYTNIYEGNALKVDWNEIVLNSKCNYIMGNPPFLGASNMSKEQKGEMQELFNDLDKYGDLDYVTGWYKKAYLFMMNTKIKCAFVSTNSICQGEQPSIIWKYLFDKGIVINFAYQSFVWNSEASSKAHVHCVIVGFSLINTNEKYLYFENYKKKVNNINGYLFDSNNIFIESFSRPLSNIEKMIRGSSPCDNGNYSFSQDELDLFLKNNPEMEKYIKKYIGAKEFINNIPRYCLWLYNSNPADYKNNAEVRRRIQNVVDFRLASKKIQTQQLAQTPLLWEANRYNGKDYIIIPRVSSEKRRYIPIGFMDGEIIANDSVQLIPNASIYEFGILTSNVHNAWMRVVAGRLEMRYRYSNLVYNSFIWPKIKPEQKQKIEKTAQAIIDARNLFSNCSLADLYDELTMPSELRKAHQENDKAVMEAYGFDWRNMTESDCVAKLMEMYQELVNKGE